jgi:hypothetical protein
MAIILSSLILVNFNEIYKIHSLINTGAIKIAFINKIYARNYFFLPHEFSRFRILKIIDNRSIIVRAVIYYILATVSIGSYIELLFLFVI